MPCHWNCAQGAFNFSDSGTDTECDYEGFPGNKIMLEIDIFHFNEYFKVL